MNGKWTKLGMVALAVLVGLFALGSVVSAQGPQPGGPEVGSEPCRSVSQGVGRMFCLPKTAWPPTYARHMEVCNER